MDAPAKLDAFFAQYEARMNRAVGDTPEVDVEASAGAFADCFVEASPVGVSCGKNDEDFRAQIPKGFEFYRSIGTQSMQIRSHEITALDEFHHMVRVHWKAFYVKKDKSEQTVEFDVIYFVQLIGDDPKIFAYITGDEEKLYRDMGLTPEQ